jgi:hypothetical protein
MFHRTTSTETHEDCQKLKVQGAHALDPMLFNPRSSLCLSLFEHPLLSLSLYFLCSSLFLFEVIEMYDRYEYQQVEARL